MADDRTPVKGPPQRVPWSPEPTIPRARRPDRPVAAVPPFGRAPAARPEAPKPPVKKPPAPVPAPAPVPPAKPPQAPAAAAEPASPPSSPQARHPLTPHSVTVAKGKPFFFSRRYKVVQVLSDGPKGPVYKAHDRLLDILVAVKFFPPEMMYDAAAVRFFKQEAAFAMRLSHENIVKLHNLEMENGKMFLVMEYVEGENLRQVMRRLKQLTLPTVVSIAASCASALDYAHKMGVLHRDLKPDNLMLNTDSILKIVDFGIARPIRSSMAEVKAEEFVEGTPGYMSPEQSQGFGLDARTDVFSLGVVLAELLIGQPVFPVKQDATQFDPPALSGVNETAAAVLRRAMAPKPEDRWPSAGALYGALASAAAPAESGPNRPAAART